MPVLLLLIFSQTGLREVVPEGVAKLLNLNPFALAVDLFNEGWLGDGTSGDTWSALLTLGAWAVALVWGGYQYMRWETHR